MICELRQTKSKFDLEWVVTCNEEVLCKISSPYETGKFNGNVVFSNGLLYKIYFNAYDDKFGKRMVDKLSFKFFDKEGNYIGSSHGGEICKVGKSFFGFGGGYSYSKMNIYTENYNIYDVGLGEAGLALCFYDQNDDNEIKSIAIKTPITNNYQDVYQIYCKTFKELVVSILFIITFDMSRFEDRVGFNDDTIVCGFSKTQTSFPASPYAECNSKFKKEFIEEIVKEANKT